MTGKAVILPIEQELRRHIAELERERDSWKDEAELYKDYWVAMCERNQQHVERIRELTAALSRLGLKL